MKKTFRILALVISLCMAFAMTSFAGFELAAPEENAEQIVQESPAPAPQDGETQGEEAPSGEGESSGESADAPADSEGGESEGESAGGPGGPGGSDDSMMAMNAGASSGDVVYSLTEEGLVFNEEAKGYESEGKVTETGADGVNMTIDEFTTNGFEVTTGEFTISNSAITKNVTGEIDANAAGGVCARVTGGILTLVNCDFVNAGKGGRNGNYTVECNKEGTLVVINSNIVQTGFAGDPEGYTEAIADPPSNLGLLISGYARANMSLGHSKTYYYGSYVETEGWAAMSTDSANSGFAFYSYDSVGKALHGGYGTYADTSCVDWFYATYLSSPEVGAIISNNGEIHMANGADATEEALVYLPEDYQVTEYYTEHEGRSVVEAGRNDFQLHSPDMMGSGAKSDYHAVLDLKDTDIITSEELDKEATLIDWSTAYGPAVGEYIDLVKGANILVKSTGAYITFDNVTTQSYTDVLLMTALNSDSMSRYAKAQDDMTGKGAEMTIKNSEVSGDVLHYDYQRNVSVTLENSTWSGAFETIDKDAWDAMWSDECKADANCGWILDTSVYFDGTGTTSNVTVSADSVWNVTGESNISSLTVEEGGTVNGIVTVDGEEVDTANGGTFEGVIIVTPQETAE